jgi:hypothetical protein
MNIPNVTSWSQAYLWFVRAIFGAALLLPMLTYGAVDFEPLSIVAILVALSGFLICWRRTGNAATDWMSIIALLCLALVSVVIFIQSQRSPDNPYEHPSWKFVRQFIGPVDGAISVSPEQTRADLIAWTPLLAFAVALQLFNRTREAFFLLKSLCYLNAGIAVFSLVQFLFFPESGGLGTKQFYLGSLTGVFVNRNSAGTFFGVGFITSIGLIVYYLQNGDYKTLIGRLIRRRHISSDEGTALFLSVGALLQVLALAATQSRGAEASTFVAILGLIALFGRGSGNKSRRSRRRDQASRSAALMRIGVITSITIILAVLIGQEAIYRMDAQSVDEARLCTYAATWHAIVDHWPWGAGFGSFQDVFPSYRAPECSGIDGIWDAAHDSYLEGLLGLGATFIVVLVAGYVALIWTFVRGLMTRRSYRTAPTIGLCVLSLISIHSLVDFSMQIPGNALFVAVLFAACATISLAKQGAPEQGQFSSRGSSR